MAESPSPSNARPAKTDLGDAGTILDGPKLPLIVWFWAAYLMATHSNGISALQLQKQLGLGPYKSAGRCAPSCAAPWSRRAARRSPASSGST